MFILVLKKKILPLVGLVEGYIKKEHLVLSSLIHQNEKKYIYEKNTLL